MKKQIKVFLKRISVGLLLLSTTAQAFLVSDYTGNKVEIDEQIGNGRWTIIMLWQLNCVPCEKQKPFIDAFHKKHNKTHAHVVGLVIDGHEYMPEIKSFVAEQSTSFPSYVVYGDVFGEQILEKTGKNFHTAPGYIVYSPKGELKYAIQRLVNIDELILHLESQFDS